MDDEINNSQVESWEDAEDNSSFSSTSLMQSGNTNDTSSKKESDNNGKKTTSSLSSGVPGRSTGAEVSAISKEMQGTIGSYSSGERAESKELKQAKDVHLKQKSRMFVMIEGSDNRFTVKAAREELKKRMAQINSNQVLLSTLINFNTVYLSKVVF